MGSVQRHERLRPVFGELVRARLDELKRWGYDVAPNKVASQISHHLTRLDPDALDYRHEYISRVMRGELGIQHLTPERVDGYAYALTDGFPPSEIPGGFDRARLHLAVYEPPRVDLEKYREAFPPLEAVAS